MFKTRPQRRSGTGKSPMKRYTLFVLIVIGSAASAIAAIAPDQRTSAAADTRNVTVIEKNQAFPLVGPVVFEDCLNDDCTETRI
jgi:hypothetical protein